MGSGLVPSVSFTACYSPQLTAILPGSSCSLPNFSGLTAGPWPSQPYPTYATYSLWKSCGPLVSQASLLVVSSSSTTATVWSCRGAEADSRGRERPSYNPLLSLTSAEAESTIRKQGPGHHFQSCFFLWIGAQWTWEATSGSGERSSEGVWRVEEEGKLTALSTQKMYLIGCSGEQLTGCAGDQRITL